MEGAHSYMTSTAPATEGLFRLLNSYGWHKMQAFVELTKSRTREELDKHKENFSSTDVAREVIAGSILQIAYVAIERYAVRKGKSDNALYFESEINRLIQENPKARSKRAFLLPEEFCVGRDIGHLPMGMIVYAGRNQYNHFGEKRLSVLNEVVFNHLHNLWPAPGNGLSFNLYGDKHFHSYSVLAALGWTDNTKELGYPAYKQDLSDVLEIEH
ncbi:hypothetical protein SCT_0868 [Sulfuricella sp. T08]|nr:hypothetical protein SCT_0868 [Sulfuricella sp. T08]